MQRLLLIFIPIFLLAGCFEGINNLNPISATMENNPHYVLYDKGTIFGTFTNRGEPEHYIEYSFSDDYSYHIASYPSNIERGKYEIISKDSEHATLKIIPPFANVKPYELEFTFTGEGDYFMMAHDENKYFRLGM